MGAFGGSALRLLATFFYALEFCCAGIILGIYSYFLSVLADRNATIERDYKAIEGLSGVAVVYTIFAVLLTCCLGGVRFFAFIGVVLDFCFIGAFIALAVLLRDGAHSCANGTFVNTPLGYGQVVSGADGAGFEGPNGRRVTYSVSQSLACRLNKACFAVAIIGAFLFLISLFLQIWVARHHQKEKKYGPSPANNYTSGSGRRKFWKRKDKSTLANKDAEAGFNGTNGAYAAGAGGFRPSHETGYTGTTVGAGNAAPASKYESGNYHTGPTGTAVDHNGYYVAPTGTAAANPYGYDNTRGTASNF